MKHVTLKTTGLFLVLLCAAGNAATSGHSGFDEPAAPGSEGAPARPLRASTAGLGTQNFEAPLYSSSLLPRAVLGTGSAFPAAPEPRMFAHSSSFDPALEGQRAEYYSGGEQRRSAHTSSSSARGHLGGYGAEAEGQQHESSSRFLQRTGLDAASYCGDSDTVAPRGPVYPPEPLRADEDRLADGDDKKLSASILDAVDAALQGPRDAFRASLAELFLDNQKKYFAAHPESEGEATSESDREGSDQGEEEEPRQVSASQMAFRLATDQNFFERSETEKFERRIEQQKTAFRRGRLANLYGQTEVVTVADEKKARHAAKEAAYQEARALADRTFAEAQDRERRHLQAQVERLQLSQQLEEMRAHAEEARVRAEEASRRLASLQESAHSSRSSSVSETRRLGEEEARQEEARQEAARQEAARQEEARQEEARQEEARQEEARQQAAREEQARQLSDAIERIERELTQAGTHRHVKTFVENLGRESRQDVGDLLNQLQGKDLAQSRAIVRNEVIVPFQIALARLQGVDEA